MGPDLPMTGPDMSQISPPLRILLIGSIIFLAAWFTVLKPGGSTGTTAPTPVASPAASNPNGPKANTSLGRAVQAAHGASQTSDAANAKLQAATGGTTTAPAPTTAAPAGKPAAAAPAKPGAAAADAGLPIPVAKALAADKIVAILFWNPKAADDRAVRKALRHVDTYRHRVVIEVANIKDIARYAPITQGVDVQQSPSVVVIGHDRKADLLTGYVDRVTINQSISDAIRAQKG